MAAATATATTRSTATAGPWGGGGAALRAALRELPGLVTLIHAAKRP
jgi:hypothetical protein